MAERGESGVEHALTMRLLLRRGSLTIALLASLLIPGTFRVSGQAAKSLPTPDGSPRASFAGYDVISVKPNISGTGNWGFNTRDTTFQATNTSLKMMLVRAYGIREALISGLPKWAESTRWDINAKLVDTLPESAKSRGSIEESIALDQARVKSILVDRFHLTAHTETKVLPIYELVLLPGPMHLVETQLPMDKRGSMMTKNREMTAKGIPLKFFVAFLSDTVGRNVVDKTGLTGDYDLTLKWSPDELAEAAKETGETDRPPQIYTALQEQLGLKLVPSKGPSLTLVVDTIDQPADN